MIIQFIDPHNYERDLERQLNDGIDKFSIEQYVNQQPTPSEFRQWLMDNSSPIIPDITVRIIYKEDCDIWTEFLEYEEN